MTDQHPLTDEMIEEIAQFEPDLTEPLRLNRAHDMRAAADWQLKKVIAHILAAEWFVLPECRISELQQEMRIHKANKSLCNKETRNRVRLSPEGKNRSLTSRYRNGLRTVC